MHIFIVYAHPDETSFTSSVLKAFINGIEEAGHTYELSDLYKMNFRSDMSLEEYKRESNQNTALSVSEDVRNEQDKINRADMIVFIYSLWWSDCPAKLKGWFDRVYTVGYAYSCDHSKSEIKVRKGLVICTAGHSEEHLEEVGIADSMRKIMLYDRMQNVGIKETEFIILGGTANRNEKVYSKHINRAYTLGKEL